MSKIIHGECLEKMKEMADNSVDAIVTDPPYGLSFMGKKWDYDVPSQEIWEECLRVLKPGGYLLAFAGTRTQHRMAVRIEDAGFEIRDMIAWIYGSGFPKSHNIGKAIDKAEGTSDWEGWGTALKPALEPITVARKPLEGTVVQNVQKYGVGGINIDACRIPTDPSVDDQRLGGNGSFQSGSVNVDKIYGKYTTVDIPSSTIGRYPANLIHDGSDEVLDLFPKNGTSNGNDEIGFGGSASRFFYCAKASKSERNDGCDDLEEKTSGELTGGRKEGSAAMSCSSAGAGRTSGSKNSHPTVKPLALMEYLVTLVSRKGSVVLDPFSGSGSTLVACKKLGRKYIGIEREQEYINIIKARLSNVKIQTQLPL
jgi:site-specific DNA-methyltransferase (adenine-specific)